MIEQSIDRRCFGAVRFVDAWSELAVNAPLLVESAGARLFRNRSGLFVIGAVSDARLAGYDSAFASPPLSSPAVGSVSVAARVKDPEGTYLPRAFAMGLPRDTTTTDPLPAASVFVPLDVLLYRAPRASLLPGAAIVRCSVSLASGAQAPFTLVRVLATNGGTLARGMTDERGEGVIAVMGIPTTTFSVGSGPVLATEISVTVQAIFDPAALTTPRYVPDPDGLEKQIGSLSVATLDAKLASGREITVSVRIP